MLKYYLSPALLIYLIMGVNLNTINAQEIPVVQLTNPLHGKEEKLFHYKLNHLLTIGSFKDNIDENELFYQVSQIETNSKGDIYILDEGNKRVQVFSKEGDYLTTLGRPGEGPGEFKCPATMVLNSNDELWVFDPCLYRVTIFSKDYSLAKSIQLEKKIGGKFDIDNQGNIILYNIFHYEIGLKNYFLYKFNNYGKLVSKFFEMPQRSKNFLVDMDLYLATMRIDNKNNTWIFYQNKNLILKYDKNENLIAKITRDLPFKLSPPKKKKIKTIPFEIYAPEIQILKNAWIDYKTSYIYILAYNPKNRISRNWEILVLNDEGVFLNRFNLPKINNKITFSVHISRSGFLWIIEEGTVIKQYKIIRLRNKK